MTQTPTHAHCDCNLAHAPAHALTDLLKAAVEVDEIADIVHSHMSLTIEEMRRFDALRLAVRRLS